MQLAVFFRSTWRRLFGGRRPGGQCAGGEVPCQFVAPAGFGPPCRFVEVGLPAGGIAPKSSRPVRRSDEGAEGASPHGLGAGGRGDREQRQCRIDRSYRAECREHFCEGPRIGLRGEHSEYGEKFGGRFGRSGDGAGASRSHRRAARASRPVSWASHRAVPRDRVAGTAPLASTTRSAAARSRSVKGIDRSSTREARSAIRCCSPSCGGASGRVGAGGSRDCAVTSVQELSRRGRKDRGCVQQKGSGTKDTHVRML